MSGDTARTEIELIIGFDFKAPHLKIVRDAGLSHRTGVIQHTHRSDSVDDYFDRSVWACVLAFAQTFGVATIVDRAWGGPGTPNRDWRSGKAKQPVVADQRALETFLENWDEAYPPEIILVWRDDTLVLAIVTEYWAQTGGPRPYADSFTYSIYSDDPLSERVAAFLGASPQASGWSISPEILLAHDSFD